MGRRKKCPTCGTGMDYDPVLDAYECPICGYSSYEYPDVTEKESEPESCAACGGPWPFCVISCKLFDK